MLKLFRIKRILPVFRNIIIIRRDKQNSRTKLKIQETRSKNKKKASHFPYKLEKHETFKLVNQINIFSIA